MVLEYVKSSTFFFFFAVSLFFIFSIPIENSFAFHISTDSEFNNPCEDMMPLFKVTTQKKVCVFESSVGQLLERGWGSLGKYWIGVCPVFTSGDANSCLIDTTPHDICKFLAEHKDFCYDFDFKPTTISECKNKYEYGYISTGSFFDIGFNHYAKIKCDISQDVKDHTQNCQDNWKKYDEITQNDVKNHKMNMAEFTNKYCLEEKYPDYSTWGCWNTKKTGTESCGSLFHFWNSMRAQCNEEPCMFRFYDGPRSTFQCPEIITSSYDHKLEYDKSTYEITCSHNPSYYD